MNGYLMFSFTDGSRRIAVERYGLADALLENASLDDWFRGAYRKEIKGSVLAADPVEEMDGRLQALGCSVSKAVGAAFPPVGDARLLLA